MARITRRRRRGLPVISRAVTFGPALGLPAWAWADLGEPLRWAGLGAMTVTGLLAWPALALTVLLTVPETAAGFLVPRTWRIRYRRAHGPRESQRSSYISKRLRRVVLAADRNRCGACRCRPGDWRTSPSGNQVYITHLDVDHYRPWIGGGLTVFSNCGALCPPCNQAKSCYWRDRDGYEHYNRERRSERALAEARWVMSRLRRHRYDPLRLVRAAWALGA